MGPLIAFVASILGSVVSDALRSPGRFEGHYRRGIELYRGWVPMRGRGVVWYVEPGSAAWIDARYLRPIDGNIFYPEKLGAVAAAVRDGARWDDPVTFYAPWGQIKLIDPGDVAESIMYAAYQPGPLWTTGDAELDAWLVNPEKYVEDQASRRYLDVTDAFERRVTTEMQKRERAAVRDRSGDLGKWMASVRDGNHRAFGAVLGGEERVAIRLYDNDLQSIQQGCLADGRPLSKGQRALLKKMAADSGRRESWIGLPQFREKARKLLR